MGSKPVTGGVSMQALAERRIPELDGIRGLAILLVLFWHYIVAPNALMPPHTVGWGLHRLGLLTWSGVDLFFVLSGFLIGGILIDARESPSFFRTFYIRRTFRILPLYIATCLLGTAVVALSPLLARILGQPMPWYVIASFTQNFWLVHHSWDTYMAATWSLAVEEQFYLALPLIIRFVPRTILTYVVGGLAVASVATRAFLYVHYGPGWGTAAYTLPYCRADALMLGVLAALVVRNAAARNLISEKSWILKLAVGLFGMGVMLLLWKGWTMATRPMSTLGYTCLALFYASLLLMAVSNSRGWWARAMRFRPLMGLGKIAYCMYLVHGPALALSMYLLGGRVHGSGANWAAAGLALVVATGISITSWRLFESKMIRIGHRFAYK